MRKTSAWNITSIHMAAVGDTEALGIIKCLFRLVILLYSSQENNLIRESITGSCTHRQFQPQRVGSIHSLHVCTSVCRHLLLLSGEITITVAVYFLHCNQKTEFYFPVFFQKDLSGLERKFNSCTLIDNIQIFLIFIL